MGFGPADAIYYVAVPADAAPTDIALSPDSPLARALALPGRWASPDDGPATPPDGSRFGSAAALAAEAAGGGDE
jgi:hypothetical protein